MPLLRDLWSTSRRRSAVVIALVLVNATGMSLAAASAGAVLVDHSVTMFVVLAAALVAAVLSDRPRRPDRWRSGHAQPE